jgi:hypothetical protein
VMHFRSLLQDQYTGRHWQLVEPIQEHSRNIQGCDWALYQFVHVDFIFAMACGKTVS